MKIAMCRCGDYARDNLMQSDGRGELYHVPSIGIVTISYTVDSRTVV